MSVRVLTGADVRSLLPMAECIEAMGAALAATSRGDVVLPLRSMMWLPDRSGLLGLMPAFLGAPRCFGMKAVTVMPGNHGTEYESHQGVVLLFEADHGSLVAVMDASAITAIRTAAVSGVATRLLARDDAGDLALLGSGVQAASHLEAMRAMRPLRRVRVWSRTADRARAFARRESDGAGVAIEPVASPRAAVEGADLICTVTAAREPVLEGQWVAAGAHINAVGACFAAARELDAAAVARARLYVDRRESALAEAGDFLLARQEGAVGDDHIRGELGDLVLGRVAGRESAVDVTLFESLGIAIEDLAAAHVVLRRALAEDRGLAVELGGRRESAPIEARSGT
jgi:ornithine cyclodeaminase/alanine dehydrogenase-like protein (mu-crystallin family)